MRWFPGFDALAVLTFAAAGRLSHQRGPALSGIATAAAPFLIALAGAWLVVRAWRAPLSWPTGIGVWVITVAGGVLLRRHVFGGEAPVSFVVVTAAVLGVMLLGWRALALWLHAA